MARGSIITRTLESGEKRYDTVIRIAGRQRWKTFEKLKDACCVPLQTSPSRMCRRIPGMSNQQEDKPTKGSQVANWTAIGVALGVGIGAAMGNIGIGIAIGAAIGASLERKQGEN